MQITLILASILSVAVFGISQVQARIESFYIPKVVAPGDTINVKLASSGYIQTVLDVSDFVSDILEAYRCEY